MDFSLTEEQEFFRKTVQDTVDKMIIPHAREMDEKDEFPWQLWWRDFARLGYLGLRYPESIGGLTRTRSCAWSFTRKWCGLRPVSPNR